MVWFLLYKLCRRIDSEQQQYVGGRVINGSDDTKMIIQDSLAIDSARAFLKNEIAIDKEL